MGMDTRFIRDILKSSEKESNPAPAPTEKSEIENLQLPENMPLTNRLDKMTREQGIWAIQNGDAWIEYLTKNKGEII